MDRIRTLGYDSSVCTGQVLAQRVARGMTPAAVVVCTDDVDTPELMAELRRTRRGSGVPVTLYGPLGGRIGDLADVLDLGADHFVEAPATSEQLGAVLEELVGPATSSGREVSGPRQAAGVGTGGPPDAETDAVIGQLHRTLDMLESRLRERDGADGDDDLDLTALGFDALPEVDEDVPPVSPDPSRSSLELPLSSPEASVSSPVATGGPRRREPTERLRPRPVGGDPATASAAARPGAAARPLPVDEQGELERIEAPRLMWMLHGARYDGELTLQRGRVTKRYGWVGGQIVGVDSNVAHDGLVDGLLRRGLLTREQYEPATELAAQDPSRAGSRLVEAGMLKPAELPAAVREQLVRIVGSTFAWPQGQWSLHPGASVGTGTAPGPSMPLLLAQGVRDHMDAERLMARVGGLDRYPVLETPPSEHSTSLAEALESTPVQQAWLEHLDGASTLRELSTRLPAEPRELLGLVYTLEIQGRLRLDDRGTAAVVTDPVALDIARIRDRLHMSRQADYFEVLGLPRDACQLDVRRAHADLNRTFDDASLESTVGASMADALVELRDLLDEAREVLHDDGLRSAYLAHLEDS